MDDITVYGGSFEECLISLETVLHRCVDFLSLSFIFLHFLGSQTLLDDDKSRDARLKPLIFEGEGH